MEEEVKGFMVARRALVCSYLEKLQSFRERVTLQEKGWAKGLSIYKAMAVVFSLRNDKRIAKNY